MKLILLNVKKKEIIYWKARTRNWCKSLDRTRGVGEVYSVLRPRGAGEMYAFLIALRMQQSR